MADVFLIRFTWDQTLLTKRGHNKAMRRLNRQMGERHKRRVMPKHFAGAPETVPGGGGYRYQRRSQKWQKHKLDTTGQNKPLVYQGHLRRSVLTGSIVRATKSRWTFQAKAPFPLTAERRREIEIISLRELKESNQMMERLYPKLANSPVFQEHSRQRIR